MQGFKGIIKDLLPAGLQVPIKYGYNWIQAKLEPEMALLPALVSRGDRVIDIGGNRGTYAYRLHCLSARVEIFEPNPVCLRVLRAWAKGKERVSVHGVGLSAAAGTAELAIPVDEWGGEHDASASLEHRAGSHVRSETVPIRTLDSYGFQDAVLIKIDVEGHEQSVIDGARDTIAVSSPAILVEIEQRHLSVPIQDVFERILSLGYQGFFLYEGRLQPIALFDPAEHQTLSSFTQGDGAYYNNFLFLAHAKVQKGTYKDILKR